MVNASLAFSPTGSWTTWLVSSATANLLTGNNKIRLTTIGSNGPNVDNLVATAEMGALEAEEAVLNGAVIASSQAGYTGSGYADYVNSSGDFIEWTVNDVNAGSFLLKFRYANGGSANRPLQLQVNGVIVDGSLDFSPTGAWTNWLVSSTTVNLLTGTNMIKLTTTGSNGPNIDNLVVSSNSSSVQLAQTGINEKGLLLPASPKFLQASVAPNPVTGNAKLILSTSSDLPVNFQLVDMLGRSYRSLRLVPKGSNTFDFSVNDLRAGSYIIILRQGSLITHARLIVAGK